MKKIVWGLIFIGIGILTQAQTSAEWFSQKATQKKYLIQQIAMLQIYIGKLERGYDIAKKGLNTIGGIKNGHLNLDKEFFASLKNINPKVRNYAKVGAILTLNQKIIEISNSANKSLNNNGVLTVSESEYLRRVFESLVEGCASLMDHLITITTAGKLEMSDAERISNIDKVYSEMNERYMFAGSFQSGLRMLCQQRIRAQSDVKMLKGLYKNVP
ncbi:MAG: hypothetical protein ABIN94_07885 [Ferruginibacter sp.]